MSLPKAKDSLGSLRSHKSVKNCSCKNLKSASSHHLLQQLVDATLGIREKEQQMQIHQYQYQVHNMRFQAQVRKIHQYQYQIQIEKNCDTALQFQAQEREILECEPCNYESKKMELCLQIQQIISIL